MSRTFTQHGMRKILKRSKTIYKYTWNHLYEVQKAYIFMWSMHIMHITLKHLYEDQNQAQHNNIF